MGGAANEKTDRQAATRTSPDLDVGRPVVGCDREVVLVLPLDHRKGTLDVAPLEVQGQPAGVVRQSQVVVRYARSFDPHGTAREHQGDVREADPPIAGSAEKPGK